jgi:putative RNA 2'-phosphotransferase
MNRLYVHLSKDEATAVKVGSRHGKPIVFTVDSGLMAADGFDFYLSANGVWLTKEVPVKYLHKLDH